MDETTDLPGRARRVEEILKKLQASRDPALVTAARELVESLMDLHGGALARMLEIADQGGASGQKIIIAFGRDDLVGSLLVLYGLHPEDIETRVRRAATHLERRLARFGYVIELLGAEAGTVRVDLRREADRGAASPDAVRAAVEEAIYAAAPDAADLIIGGLDTEQVGGFVPVSALTDASPAPIRAKSGI